MQGQLPPLRHCLPLYPTWLSLLPPWPCCRLRQRHPSSQWGLRQGWRRWTTAPLPQCAPPQWRTTRTTTTTTTAAQGMWWSHALSRPLRAEDPCLPLPDCRLFTPPSTVAPSPPRGPPGWIVPATGEVEQQVPLRERVVGAIVQGCSLLLLVLPCLARHHPRLPFAPPIFPSPVATPPPLAPLPCRLPCVVASLRR